MARHSPAFGALPPVLAGWTVEAVGIGESGAQVWRCHRDGASSVYLKMAPIALRVGLRDEAERLRWMSSAGLRVAAVRDAGAIEELEYMISDELFGRPASDAAWARRARAVAGALGSALAALHSTPVADCPFDQRIATQLARARRRISAGLVKEDDFDEERLGRSAESVFMELVSSIPAAEDVVFTHGDFCLPNIILGETSHGAIEVAGLIDCGRAGLADRHQDLALGARSIAYNLGSEWVATFFDAYGLAPDAAKLEFFSILDEFF